MASCHGDIDGRDRCKCGDSRNGWHCSCPRSCLTWRCPPKTRHSRYGENETRWWDNAASNRRKPRIGSRRRAAWASVVSELARKRDHFCLIARPVCMEYRCEATSPVGFVQQLVSCYLPHGYWFYVSGCIPEHKDPRSVDEKLLAKYGISLSRSSRARRKRVGIANIHYLWFFRIFRG